MVSSSNCFLSFFDGGLRKVKGYIRTKVAQVGMRYLESIDQLLTWAAGDDHHRLSFWDLGRRVLRFQVAHHTSYILDICELASHELVASSDMNKNIFLWSVTKFSRSKSAQPEESSSARSTLLRLRGHSMMVKALCYAPQNDLLLGAGVEYDAYAWDPFSGQMTMMLAGHQHCLCKIAVLYDPTERAMTLDVAGNFKVWNINRDVRHTADVLQSFEVVLSLPYKICDMAVVYDDGNYVYCTSSQTS